MPELEIRETIEGELFYEVDPRHRRAMLDVKRLPEAQDRGLGTTAPTWLVDRELADEPDADAVDAVRSPRRG